MTRDDLILFTIIVAVVLTIALGIIIS
jgi:hypothetical protein